MVILQAFNMVDWISSSGTLNAKAFFAFTMRFWASFFTKSRKHPVAARLLTVVTVVSNGDSFSGKYLIF